jgi:hypothetical protein
LGHQDVREAAEMPDSNRWDVALHSVEAARTWTDREIGPVLRDTMAACTDGVFFAGRSDELFREAERAEELAVDPERAISARRRATRYNNLAIEAFDQRVPAAVETLRSELQNVPSQDLDRPLRTFEAAIHEKLLDTDFNKEQTRIAAAG